MLHAHPAPIMTLLDSVIWLNAATYGRRPRLGPLRGGVGAGRFQHSEWAALVSRFANDQQIDFQQMARVRRLVEEYLRRLAAVDPDTFIDTDDQLAFFLNAYNAITVHQVLRHMPVASIRSIPYAFLRPYPIGRRNLSLHVLHATVIRSFGDPRVHVALYTTARSAPRLHVYEGKHLQSELDAALQTLLADPARGAHYNPSANTLYLSQIFRWFAGDFIDPAAMPGVRQLFRFSTRVELLQQVLLPYMPPDLAHTWTSKQPSVRFLPYDW